MKTSNLSSANLKEKWSFGCLLSKQATISKRLVVDANGPGEHTVLPHIMAPNLRACCSRVRPLDDFGRPAIADLDNVIDVIAHGHKQIEKQFAPILHFHLHGSTPLESLATSNDQSQVMSAES